MGANWETSSDWDSGSDNGTVHEDTDNTDYNDATVVTQGFSAQTPSPSFGSTGVYYPMHEDSGSTLYDFSGNNQDGTLNSGTVGETGPIGTTCYYFNASNNDNAAIYPSLSSSVSQLSVFVWMKTTNTGQQVIASHDNSNYYAININRTTDWNGEYELSLTDSGGNTSTYQSGIYVADGRWHLLGFVYDSGSVDMYIDGVSQNNVSHGSQLGTGSTRYGYIGDGSNASSFNGSQEGIYFTGNAWEYRLYYGTALSQSEVQSLYDGEDSSGVHTTSTKAF